MVPAPRDDFNERLNALEYAVSQIEHELAVLKEHRSRFIQSLDRVDEIVTRITRLEERLDGMMKMLSILQTLLFALLTVLISAAVKFLER